MATPGSTDEKVTAYLCVRGADAAIAFYKKAFGATEEFRLTDTTGKVGHAQIKIGGSMVMLADEHPDFGVVAPPALGGSPVSLNLNVANADAAYTRAIEAGATALRPPKNEFYGERSATVVCPFGYRWTMSHPVEDVAPAEMQRRFTEMMKGG
jgi:PhnB protein